MIRFGNINLGWPAKCVSAETGSELRNVPGSLKWNMFELILTEQRLTCMIVRKMRKTTLRSTTAGTSIG